MNTTKHSVSRNLLQGRQWLRARADGPHARAWLAVLSFTESFIFIVPPDPLLAALAFVRKERWLYFTVLTIVTSLIGAALGYAIGAVLFDTVGASLIALYGLEAHMARATELVHESVFVFTLTVAFTPIPFKAAVLAAGFTKANFGLFLLAALIGRTGRYMLIGYVSKMFGDHATFILRRVWLVATIIGTAGLVLYLLHLLAT